MAANQVEIEVRQQVVGAVAPAKTDNAFHLGIGEHPMQLIDAALDGSGKVQVAIQNGRQMEWTVAATLQRGQTCLKRLSRNRAGRCDYADSIPGAQGRRADAFLLCRRRHQERFILTEKLAPAE